MSVLMSPVVQDSRRKSFDLWVLSTTTSRSDSGFRTLGRLSHHIQGFRSSELWTFLEYRVKLRLPPFLSSQGRVCPSQGKMGLKNKINPKVD